MMKGTPCQQLFLFLPVIMDNADQINTASDSVFRKDDLMELRSRKFSSSDSQQAVPAKRSKSQYC